MTGAGWQHSGRPGSAARELERYAALFAERTKVMRSSAMRDLMALTEREDVISLAGGLPDTSTFPADSYAARMILSTSRPSSPVSIGVSLLVSLKSERKGCSMRSRRSCSERFLIV